MLTRAIFAEGCKSVAAGMNAMDLRRGINLAVDSVVAHLKSQAKMISTSEEIAQVNFLLVLDLVSKCLMILVESLMVRTPGSRTLLLNCIYCH